LTLWFAVAIAGCLMFTRGSSPPAGAPPPAGPPARYEGALRHGDDDCNLNLCDRFQMSWASPTRVRLESHTDGFRAYVSVRGPEGERNSGGVPTQDGVFEFDAVPGTAYDVFVKAYDGNGQGRYALVVTPTPQAMQPPEERPVPPTAAPEDLVTDEQVDEQVQRVTSGYEPTGDPIEGTLDQVPTMRIRARHGRCYAAVFVLLPGAQRPYHAPGLELDLNTDREERGGTEGTGESARVWFLGEYCASGSGTVELSFVDGVSLQRTSDAGTGPFRAQFYQRRISDADLRERDQGEQDEFCTTCVRQRLQCLLASEHSTCEEEFATCLRDNNLRSSQCRP
jgi:hypothetical protein